MRFPRPTGAVVVALTAVVVWWPFNDEFSLPKATVVVLAALVAVAVASVGALRDRVVVVRDPRTLVLLLALAAVIVVTTVVAPHPVQALVGHRGRYAGAATALAGVALAILAAQRSDERGARQVAWAFVAGAAVVAGVAAVQLLGGRAATSTMGNIDFVSGWLAAALPLAVWAAVARSHRDEVALVGGAVAVLVVVVLVRLHVGQGLAAGAVGAGVVVGAWAVERGVGRRVDRRHVVAGAVVVVAGLVVLAPFLRAQLDDGLRERRLIWSTAVRDVADRPVLGHGLDSYGERFLRLRPAEHARRWPAINAGAAHDVPLDMAIGGGVALLGLYLAVVVVTGRRLVVGLRSSAGDRRLLLAGVGGAWIAYQLQSLVSINVPALAVAHWVLTGTVLALTAGAGRTWRVPRPAALAVAVLAAAAIVPALRPVRAELALANGLRGKQRPAAFRRATELAPWEPVYASFLAVRVPQQEGLRAFVRAAKLADGDPYAAADAADAAEAAGDAGLARRWRAVARADDPRNPRWRRR